MKAKSDLVIKVAYSGRPQPSVEWTKDGSMPESLKERCQIDTNNSTSKFTLESVNRYDTGKYVVAADNSGGNEAVAFSVRVIDTPGPCSNLKVVEVTRSSCTLSWDQPENDGCSTVTSYAVQKRESSRKAWTTVANTDRMTHKVQNLNQGDRYLFRVCAENNEGVGEPLELQELIRVSEKAGCPEKIE